MTHRRPAILLASCVLAAACGEDFDPYNRVNSLRVLAIKSEPVAPAPGEETKLTPLIYTPSTEAVTFEWSWCPVPGSASDSYPCLVTAEQLSMLAGGAPVSYALGTGETATFKVELPAEPLKALCSGMGMGGFRPDCNGGFPVQVKLVAKTGTDRIEAVRTVRIRLEERDANQNPTLAGVSAIVNGGEQPLDEMAMVMVPRDEKVQLRAGMTDAAAEPYVGPDENGVIGPRRERVFLTWFVEGGDTKSERTIFIDGVQPLTETVKQEWTPPKTKDYMRDTAKVIVIARDNRGGVGWTSGVARLGGMP